MQGLQEARHGAVAAHCLPRQTLHQTLSPQTKHTYCALRLSSHASCSVLTECAMSLHFKWHLLTKTGIAVQRRHCVEHISAQCLFLAAQQPTIAIRTYVSELHMSTHGLAPQHQWNCCLVQLAQQLPKEPGTRLPAPAIACCQHSPAGSYSCVWATGLLTHKALVPTCCQACQRGEQHQ